MSWIDVLVAFVEIFGLPIAITGIWLSMRSSSRSHDVQVILSFADSFRNKWENGGSDLLDRLEPTGLDSASDEDLKQLRYLLNWIDWVGRLAKTQVLTNEDVILNSLKPSLKRALDLGAPMVAADEKEKGADFWAGLAHVKERLELV